MTLLVATTIVSFTYAVMFFVLSIKRNGKDFFVYSVAYLCASLTSILTMKQGIWHPILSVVLLNTFFFIFIYCMTGGFRLFFGKSFWSKPVIIGFVITMIGFMVFTFGYPHFSIRVIINSLFNFFIMISAYIAIYPAISKESERYRVFAISLIVIQTVFISLRLLIAIINFKAEGTVIEDSYFSIGPNLIAFVSIGLWPLMILAMDYAKMLKQLQQKNTELTKIAIKDTLTGLYNRAYLDSDVTRFTTIAQTYQEELSFILFDLDDFKKVNDVFGHDVGDVTLSMVAKTLTSAIRPSDIAYRWGGEEFLVILPHTDLKTASSIAEEIRIAVKKTRFPGPEQVTISIGVSDFKASEPLNRWFKRTDYALGQAKAKGKDQVVTWSSDKPLPLSFAKIEWQQDWNSGEKNIDLQHQELVTLVNDLATVKTFNSNDSMLVLQLEYIIEHTKSHFNYEESVLKSIQFEGYKDHCAEHARLLEKFTKMIDEVKNNTISIKECFDQITGTLIIGHMFHYDRLFYNLFQDSTNPKEKTAE